MLKEWVRYWSPRGLGFWGDVRSSGLVVREMSLFLIACETMTGEKRVTELPSEQSLRILPLTVRTNGSLEWGTGETNCLEKTEPISPLRASIFLRKGDGLIGRGFGTFTFKGFYYVPWAWRDAFIWAWFNGLDPFQSIRVCDVVADLCVEFVLLFPLWVRRGREA